MPGIKSSGEYFNVSLGRDCLSAFLQSYHKIKPINANLILNGGQENG